MKLPIASVFRALPIPAREKWNMANRISRPLESDKTHMAVARMREGFRMTLNRGESYERIMYYSGLYAPVIAQLFKRIVQSGDTVIDGGANIGFFSLLSAKLVGRTGSVHSFEPIPATFAQLSQNIKLNGYFNITANCQALASSVGQVEFEVPLETETNQSLGRLASALLSGRGSRVAVQTRTLDSYVETAGIGQIKLAKLDLEGSELDAIRGMQRILGAHHITYLICELNTPLLDQQGIPHSALRDVLADHGYEAYFIKASRGYRRPLRAHLEPVRNMPHPDSYGDYLFVAPGQVVPHMHEL